MTKAQAERIERLQASIEAVQTQVPHEYGCCATLLHPYDCPGCVCRVRDIRVALKVKQHRDG